MRVLHYMYLLGALCIPALAETPKKPDLKKPKLVFEGWFEVLENHQKTGYQYEKIEQDLAQGWMLYTNTLRKIDENQKPVETHVVSISRFEDLFPVSYSFKEIRPNALTEVTGTMDPKSGLMKLAPSNTSVAIPEFTVFSGLVNILIQRQTALDPNKTYKTRTYFEDTHDVKEVAWKILKKDLKTKSIQFLFQVDTIKFEWELDQDFHTIATTNYSAPIELRRATKNTAKDSWARDKLFR